MKILLASLAFAIALPGAANAAEGAMEKCCCCCCDKMKHEGKDCCDEKQAETAGEPTSHEHHASHEMPAPQAPAN